MGSRAVVHVVRLLAVATVAGVVLAGGSGGTSTGAAKPKTGGTFAFLFNTEPPGMDPIQLREVPNISPALAVTAIFDQLVYADPTSLKVKPKIASSLTTQDKGLTWVLKIRPNVRFSDGTTFDASAVQYNWQRIADPANRVPFAGPAQEIATYETPDPLTLKVSLKAANPLWDQLVARNLSTIGSPTALKANATAFQTKPVGAGPYLLKEWIRTVSSTFVRNPDYWQTGKPYIDQIDMKFVTDDNARLSTMLAGSAQAALDGAYQNLTQYRAQSNKFAVVNTPTSGGGYGLLMNTSKAPFTDLRVRQALSLVLDSKELVERANFGDSTAVIKAIDDEFSPWYNPKIKLPKTDPVAAQKLVDQVVAEQSGRPISFTYLVNNTPNHIRMAEAIQTVVQSKLRNVEVKLDIQQPTATVPKQAAGDFQASLGSARWTDPALDLPAVFRTGSGLNYMRYSNPTVDAALTQLTTSTDSKTTQQAHETVIENVLKDLPMVWVSRFQTFYGYDKTQLKNWKMFYELRPLFEEMWLAKPKG